jgi:hypothetical protein
MNEVQTILEKLRKLKNLQEGAAAVGSIQEAANAAARFQEILLKHNLSEEEVMRHSVERKLEMVNGILDCSQYRIMRKNVWADKMIPAIANTCMCRVVNLSGTTKKSILGEKQNVEAAFYMIEQMISKTVIACQLSWDKYTGDEGRGIYWNGFLSGCTDAIIARLMAEETRHVAENKEMGLMVINKRDLATKYMHQVFGNGLRGSRLGSAGKSGYDGKEHGRRAGENMSLNKGVGGGNSKQLN